MEAARFGFGATLPPAYKFDPTDADIVAHYLLPRALGLPNPHEHAVIDDDPASCPPWELLRRHGHAGSDQAFFFGPVPDSAKNGGRMTRAVPAGGHGPGGTWCGQKGHEAKLVLVRGGGTAAEMEIEYEKYNLTYYRAGVKVTSGWVMHEYQITAPPLPHAMISRVKITDKAKKDQRRQQQQKAATAATAAKQFVPYPDQPGPSNYLGAGAHVARYDVVSSNGEASSSGAQNDGITHQGDNSGLAIGETAPAGYFGQLLVAGEGDGYGFDDVSNYFTQEDMNYFLSQGEGNDFEYHDDGNGGCKTQKQC